MKSVLGLSPLTSPKANRLTLYILAASTNIGSLPR
jgi:hypothetical protein